MNMINGNRVGVVIPTRGRPNLVFRAVMSVLGQTHTDLEVTVVLDGPDEVTLTALAGVDDERLRVEVNARRGASAARNTGVRLTQADWVAFLDDDDLWLPNKLEVQLSLVKTLGVPLPIVSCRSLNVSKLGKRAYPLRLPRPSEPVSEYLFDVEGPLARRGSVQTPTILVPRELAIQIPFDESLPRHQDWDWLLRAVRVPGAGLVMTPEILVEVDQYSDTQRISGSQDWRHSFDWIRERRELVTRRAYAAFLLTVIPASAARGGAGFKEFILLLKEAMRGRPGLLQLAVFAIWCLFPRRMIDWARRIAVLSRSG